MLTALSFDNISLCIFWGQKGIYPKSINNFTSKSTIIILWSLTPKKCGVIAIVGGGSGGEVQIASNCFLPLKKELGGSWSDMYLCDSINPSYLNIFNNLPEVISSFESKHNIIKYPSRIDLKRNISIS